VAVIGRKETATLDLTPRQLAVLERLRARGFRFVSFPLYASALGIRKGNCAALLQPAESGEMGLLSDPCYLVEGNLSVRIHRGNQQWFVWKKKKIEATLERLAELSRFTAELKESLELPD
jgi:hypothetical protein